MGPGYMLYLGTWNNAFCSFAYSLAVDSPLSARLTEGLENDALDIDVCCNDDHLVENQEADLFVYDSVAFPEMLPIPAGDECDGQLRAMMQETVEPTRSHIDQYDTGILSGIEGEYMDLIFGDIGEVTLLYELTRTVSFFGASGVLEDVLTAYNEDAYLWDKCFDLANNAATRANAVKNAGKCYPTTPDIVSWL
ncbi:hypothetical protein BP00DRAFT_443560 [Aspergillus indologenus CBS 114.80]|uniref:Uncharacterized protein n=1 Tax=Aspergillus indologenus CBS 114.80 TaxID=1450541 RepID=A0A2V5JEU2_9EURO|nr:hypothetical protein BP00DRAFT_443560 [Aspergillus indologenus CBS 114.80]